MWSHYERDMWLGKWEPINLSHHCTKFGAWKSYENGDNVFILSSDIPLQHVQRDMWYGKWEPLTQSLPGLVVADFVEIGIWRFEFIIALNMEILFRKFAQEFHLLTNLISRDTHKD